MMTQRERVLWYIQKYGSITALDAFKDLGITQLSARLCELQDMGYRFNKVQESAKNRFGEKVCFIRYSLTESEDKTNAEQSEA